MACENKQLHCLAIPFIVSVNSNKKCYITETLLYQNKLFIYSCKLKNNVKLYQQLFLLALNSINQAISFNFFLHAYKNFWAVFYFFLLFAKTGSVESVLPEIKLVWPKHILKRSGVNTGV